MGKNIHSTDSSRKMLQHGMMTGMGAFRPKPPKKPQPSMQTKPAPVKGAD